MFPYVTEVPYITTDQMREVDRAMVEDMHIELIQMMENAGRNLAHLARKRFLDGNPVDKKVIILAGAGINGGGAMVCARRLHCWGVNVHVFLTKPPETITGVPGLQLNILERMNVSFAKAEEVTHVESADLIVDGIIGYGLTGAPHGTAADLVRWANAQDTPILALDVPSGVDATRGSVFEPSIKAVATMTLALPKEGLNAPVAKKNVGELYLADISVPLSLYTMPTIGVKVPHLFAEDEILRIR